MQQRRPHRRARKCEWCLGGTTINKCKGNAVTTKRGHNTQRKRTRVTAAAYAIAHAVETQAVHAGRRAAAPQLSQGERRSAVKYAHDGPLLACGGQFAAVVSKG